MINFIDCDFLINTNKQDILFFSAGRMNNCQSVIWELDIFH